MEGLRGTIRACSACLPFLILFIEVDDQDFHDLGLSRQQLWFMDVLRQAGISSSKKSGASHGDLS